MAIAVGAFAGFEQPRADGLDGAAVGPVYGDQRMVHQQEGDRQRRQPRQRRRDLAPQAVVRRGFGRRFRGGAGSQGQLAEHHHRIGIGRIEIAGMGQVDGVGQVRIVDLNAGGVRDAVAPEFRVGRHLVVGGVEPQEAARRHRFWQRGAVRDLVVTDQEYIHASVRKV